MAKSFTVEVGAFVEIPSVSGVCDVMSVQSPKNMDDGNILIVKDSHGREYDVCEAWVRVLAMAHKEK